MIDGDTIVVGTNIVRLAGIDAPEKKQAYGAEAARALADKVEGREVVVEWRRRGRYRRIIGTVHIGDRNINHELVKEGYAWFDPRYSSDPYLALAHNAARNQHLGLWASASPTAPWHHRTRRKRALSGVRSQQGCSAPTVDCHSGRSAKG